MGTELYILSNGQTTKMIENKYKTELDLQILIAQNPQLLATQDEEILLVKREIPVINHEETSCTYSLDHLFVNQNGMPILVEVKRSNDTRIRREVIAQMLDYASRAAKWDIQYLRQCFKDNNNSDSILQAYDTDEFWQQIAINLKAENLRLVFVADTIPDTLTIIIDFLNRNLKNIEVCGVEIHQYKQAETTLISSNIICSSTLNQCTNSARSIEWTADTFARQILTFSEEKVNKPIAEAANSLRIFSEKLGLTCTFGRGSKYATYTASLDNFRIFKASNWLYKNNVFKCTVEFPILDFAQTLGQEWNEQKVSDMLTNFPNKNEAYAQKLIWKSNQYLYIDISLLTDETNMKIFEHTLKQLCKMIENAASKV